jgi:DegV family protein with EDD domain
MSIRIVTDSTSYIPLEIRESLNISAVSLSVNFETEGYREEDIDNETFYEKMNQSPSIPTSSQPSFEEIYNAFEDIIKMGDDVLAIFLSSDMSGAYSTAHLVKDDILEKYPDAAIEIVDSRTNCMQLGFLPIAAAKASNQGKTMKQILEIINKIINTSRFIFAPQTLEYLKKGGRIGGASALLASVLQIKPILTVMDGKTAILAKVRTSNRAIQKMLDIFCEDFKNKGIVDVIVHHINCQEKGRELAKLIEDIINRPVPVYQIGPVIGLHVGPGTVGIAYYTNL